jgi:hypothetical protein
VQRPSSNERVAPPFILSFIFTTAFGASDAEPGMRNCNYVARATRRVFAVSSCDRLIDNDARSVCPKFPSRPLRSAELSSPWCVTSIGASFLYTSGFTSRPTRKRPRRVGTGAASQSVPSRVSPHSSRSSRDRGPGPDRSLGGYLGVIFPTSHNTNNLAEEAAAIGR